jgi:SPP1 gp7 family putative phage head morphogenesis protein
MAMAKNDGLVKPRLGTRILAEARLTRYEAKIERAIKAALARQKTKAMTALRTQAMTAAAPPDPFDYASWDSAVTDEVLPIVGDVLDDISRKVFNFLALPPEVRARILGEIDLASRTQSFVAKVTTIGPDVSNRLIDELTVGVGKGEGIDTLARRLDFVFNIGDNIAERIARTETHGAAESTKHESANAIANAGYELTHTWVATDDERTRDSHSTADGQTVPLNEPFQIGDVELTHPGDPDGDPGEVINCRCSETYEMAETRSTDDPDLLEVG